MTLINIVYDLSSHHQFADAKYNTATCEQKIGKRVIKKGDYNLH